MKRQFSEERIAFLINGVRTIGYSCTQELNFNQNLSSYTKINLKLTIDLNEKPKTIKLQNENIGEKSL